MDGRWDLKNAGYNPHGGQNSTTRATSPVLGNSEGLRKAPILWRTVSTPSILQITIGRCLLIALVPFFLFRYICPPEFQPSFRIISFGRSHHRFSCSTLFPALLLSSLLLAFSIDCRTLAGEPRCWVSQVSCYFVSGISFYIIRVSPFVVCMGSTAPS